MKKRTTTLTHINGRTETFQSVTEAAAFLRIPTPALYRYAHNGRPYLKQWTIRIESIEPQYTPPQTWKQVHAVDPTGAEHTFESIKIASDATGLSRGTIESSYRRGRSVKGWTFTMPGTQPVQEAVSEKCCPKCATVKSATAYTADARTRDGLAFWCKDCASAARREYAQRPEAIAKRKARLARYAEQRRNSRLVERVEAEPTYFLPRLVENVTLPE